MKTWMKVALILLLVGGFLAWMIIGDREREGRLTAQASGTLTAVTFQPDDESSSLDETRFEYRYVAAGAERQGKDSFPGDRSKDFQVGQSVTICYDPKQPADSDLREGGDAPCGE